MGRPISNLRLFVAVYPPADAAAALVERVTGPGMPAGRATRADQVHMTLQFIGDTPARLIDDVRESVDRSAAGLPSFELVATRLVGLPERGAARLLAAQTDEPPALLELQRRLALRLARRARAKPGDRFRPHLTLLRMASPLSGGFVPLELRLSPMRVSGVALMRSTLGPLGAEHHAVHLAELAG